MFAASVPRLRDAMLLRSCVCWSGVPRALADGPLRVDAACALMTGVLIRVSTELIRNSGVCTATR